MNARNNTFERRKQSQQSFVFDLFLVFNFILHASLNVSLFLKENYETTRRSEFAQSVLFKRNILLTKPKFEEIEANLAMRITQERMYFSVNLVSTVLVLGRENSIL